ncbi:unnamed protein product [Parnassius apollo]|uniref:(apollo) hypothetical protein n=1 Tax=Parnassius apollo TaxID=110799 RepID=A0A8S3WQA5_PARAO|nr:unnamed protein product [Parnassius apollo]
MRGACILAHYARTLTDAGGEHEAGGLDAGGVRVYSRALCAHTHRRRWRARGWWTRCRRGACILAHCAHTFTEAGGEHGAGGLDDGGVRVYSRTMRAHSPTPVASTGLVDSMPAGCVHTRALCAHSPRPVASTRLVDSMLAGCVYILAHCAHTFTEAGGEHGTGGLDDGGVRVYSRTMRAHAAMRFTEAGGEHGAGRLDDSGVRV